MMAGNDRVEDCLICRQRCLICCPEDEIPIGIRPLVLDLRSTHPADTLSQLGFRVSGGREICWNCCGSGTVMSLAPSVSSTLEEESPLGT
jgi:hypothetical protein